MKTDDAKPQQHHNQQTPYVMPSEDIYAQERELWRKFRRLMLLCAIAGLSSLYTFLTSCSTQGA